MKRIVAFVQTAALLGGIGFSATAVASGHSSGQIESFGYAVQYSASSQYNLCIDGTSATANTQLESNTCATSTESEYNSQLWELQYGNNGQNQLIMEGNGEGNLCAQATSYSKGAAVELETCDAANHAQWWTFINGAIVATASSEAYADQLCLNVQSGSNSPGAKIDLNYCTESNAIEGGPFPWAPDGAQVFWPNNIVVAVTSYGTYPFSNYPIWSDSAYCMADTGTGVPVTTSCTSGSASADQLWIMDQYGEFKNNSTGTYVNLSEGGALTLSSSGSGYGGIFSLFSSGTAGSCSVSGSPEYCTFGAQISGYANMGASGCLEGDYDGDGNFYYISSCTPGTYYDNPGVMLGIVPNGEGSGI